MEQGDQAGQAREVWAVGAAYDAYVGRWSRPVAAELLDWLQVPGDRRWLDVGCGTGGLVETIVERAAPRMVLGVDRSAGFVEHACARVNDPRVRFTVGDAQALPVADGAFDAAVSGLVLNFVGEPARMVAEMARAVAPGGAVALYVWDYTRGMELIRAFWDAATELDPRAAALDEGLRFPVCAPAPLAALMAAAGLAGVETRTLVVPTRFRDLDDYWSPFLGGQGPAPAYASSLSQEGRAALRARLGARLPVAADGSIRLAARAFAVRGNRA